MNNILPVFGKTFSVILGSLLLSFAPSLLGAKRGPSGMADIDAIRENILVSETDASNCDSRRTALMRWWRFFWRQGYDMSSCDAVAERLLRSKHDNPQNWRAIEEGFQALEALLENPVWIEEAAGEAIEAASRSTDWPFYMGPTGMNQGSSPDVGPSEGAFAWRFPKAYAWSATPVVEGDKIYLSSPGIDVVGFCLDEESGKVLWRARQHGDRFYSTPTSKHTPWVTGEHVIVRADAADVTASNLMVFDKKTGERITSPDSGDKPDRRYLAFKHKSHGVVLADSRSGKEIWKYETPEYLTGDPALEGTSLYAATKQGSVHAFDVGGRQPLWSVTIDAPLRGTVTIGQSLLYVGSRDGRLFALNRKTGGLVWGIASEDLESRCYQYYSNVLEAGNRIYVGGASGYVYCYNKSDGALLWKYRLADWVRSRPLLKGKTLYVATLDGTLTALMDKGDSAQLLWSKELAPHGFTSDLRAGKHGLLACGRDYMMYAVDFDTGEVRWKHGILDGAWVGGEFFFADWSGGLLGSPTVVGGVVYVGGPDGFVNAVDVESGEEIWKFETAGTISNATTVIDGKVLFGHLGGLTEHHGFETEPAYYALDQKTGEVIWQSEAFGKVWVSGAYHDGVMCIGNMDGMVFGLNPSTGEKLWSYYTAKDTPQENRSLTDYHHGWPPGVYSIPVSDDDYFYVGSWSGYYFAFEQKTGKLVWRCQTGNPETGGGLPDSAAPMLWKDHLYVQKQGSRIAAINRHSGELVWDWKPPVPHLQNGTIAGGGDRIFGSTSQRVTILPYTSQTYAFSDVEGGSELKWKIPGGAGLTAPVLTEDKLIFGSSVGMFVTCVDPETGELKWRLFTGGEVLENVPAIYGNKVFCISKNGWLNAIK